MPDLRRRITMFCQKCGKENPDGATFCNSCGVSMQAAGPSAKDQHNEVIRAKIQTKKDEIARISYWGPGLVICLGILFCLTIIGIIPGLIVIGFGVWWNYSRENEGKKLESEIKELETELR